MYISAILEGYELDNVPFDIDFRKTLAAKTETELVKLLKTFGPLHNKSDISSMKRLIRAIEIATFSKANTLEKNNYPPVKSLIYGIDIPRDVLKKRITSRLTERLENGMIEEVEGLLSEGLTHDQLKFYGLEYKFVTQFLSNELNRNDMFQKLNSAIHQYAKRQMTWFRRMEKKGHTITWIDYILSDSEKSRLITQELNR